MSKNVIANRYEVQKHIGQGGMADVFLAVDTILNRQVAIKILRADLSTDAVSILRFEREAQAATALAHPNIVEIYDVGDYKGHHYIVMEYVQGKTLKQVIRERGPLLVEEAVDIMKQLTSATAEAHGRGIIHRDIKPQNVIIKADGSVKILDFGIATAKGSMQLTQANNVMGSVHYLAPELAKGEPASAQSDIYALGVVLYEMLAKDVPFKADQAVQVALMHMREKFPSIRDVNPSVPVSVENVITRAVAKDPSKRYSSCDEMLRDLNTCLRPERLNEPLIVIEDTKAKSSKKSNQKAKLTEKHPASHETEAQRIAREERQRKIEASQKKEKRITILLIALLSLLAAAGIYFALSLSGLLPFGEKTSVVPDLEGMSVSEAKEACLAENLVLDTSGIVYTLTTDTEKGLIISEDPEIGSEVAQGTKVNVTVSSGIGTVMRNYVGMNILEAESQLAEYSNLKVSVIEEYSDQPAGTVIRQEQIAAGEMFSTETVASITLVYSSYPTVEIPSNIIGMQISEAVSLLESMGISVRTSNRDTTQMTQEELDNLTVGVVIDCSPAAGTQYTQRENNYVTLYFY